MSAGLLLAVFAWSASSYAQQPPGASAQPPGPSKPAGQERLLTELGQRFRDVRQGPDGAVYLLTDETAGAMPKVERQDP